MACAQYSSLYQFTVYLCFPLQLLLHKSYHCFVLLFFCVCCAVIFMTLKVLWLLYSTINTVFNAVYEAMAFPLCRCINGWIKYHLYEYVPSTFVAKQNKGINLLGGKTCGQRQFFFKSVFSHHSCHSHFERHISLIHGENWQGMCVTM